MKAFMLSLAFAKYVGDAFFPPGIIQSSPFQHHVTVVESIGFLAVSEFQNQWTALLKEYGLVMMI